ncbi:MAG: peptide-methionine (S)-S-oxide reductase MsrA, partial [Phycisphaerae bacterium]|nr:peptide-methionine (S)-S-oxide reductase MsrA [Phycisphaerae bacterium]
GHAETVKVTFDPARISYDQLLAAFFKFHDPTQLNRQGPDIGDQYRSAIFTDNEEQAKAARAFIERQQASERFKNRRIVTQIVPASQAGAFWMAEEYHQDYHLKNGGHCPLPND